MIFVVLLEVEMVFGGSCFERVGLGTVGVLSMEHGFKVVVESVTESKMVEAVSLYS